MQKPWRPSSIRNARSPPSGGIRCPSGIGSRPISPTTSCSSSRGATIWNGCARSGFGRRIPFLPHECSSIRKTCSAGSRRSTSASSPTWNACSGRAVLRGLSAVAGALLVASLPGCMLNMAPPKWLPTADEAAVYGGWIRLEIEGRAPRTVVEGELLAVNEDSVWVLAHEGTRAFSARSVRKGTLTAYDPKAGTLGNWTLVGTLSTASHGVVLLISAPVWILTGTIATAAQAHKP